MRSSIRIAAAFIALASLASGPALAQEARKSERAARLERADADKSGDVTFEEFSAALSGGMSRADTNGDGKITVEEAAAEIGRMRAVKAAERMIKRFDKDGDGQLTVAEIQDRQKTQFERLDRDKDGKISADEIAMLDKRGAKAPKQQ